MSKEIEELIGQSAFLYKGRDAIIKIYKPVKKWSDGDEFSCGFSIEAGELKYKAENIGYDSMHALILALSSIGHYLRESDVIDSRLIEWPGGVMQFPSF